MDYKDNEIIDILNEQSEIIFGPFCGELGWEITRWSGFVRWYILNNPTKRYIISTRLNSYDLYSDLNVEKDLFIIEKDNDKIIPECYMCHGLSEKMRNNLFSELKSKYPNAYIFDPFIYDKEGKVFNPSNMDFSYHPRSENNIKIYQILDQFNKSRDKKILTLTPRNRMESDFIRTRNWGKERWEKLFDLLDNTDKYFCFISGTPETSIFNEQRKNIVNLYDYLDVENNMSLIGLTISAMRLSNYSIGTQTAGILLSNLLRVPTLVWGHQPRRISNENIFNTNSIILHDEHYNYSPDIIFDRINALI